MDELAMFQPRTTADGMFSSQVFTKTNERLRVALDFRGSPTGMTSFSKSNPSSTQLCFDVPKATNSTNTALLQELTEKLFCLIKKEKPELEVNEVTPLLVTNNESYPPFVKICVPKTDFSDTTHVLSFLVDSLNNHLSFQQCKNNEVLFLDCFLDSVYCKNGNMSMKLQLIQTVFSDAVREQPKLSLPTFTLMELVKKKLVVSKVSKPNATSMNSVFQLTGDDKMIVVRIGSSEGGLFPMNYSYTPSTDCTLSKGRVKLEVYNKDELEALLLLESNLISAAKNCTDTGIAETDTVDCEGLIPENYTAGTPLLVSAKIDASDAQVCVDTKGVPVPLEKLRGCRFKHVDMYMSNVYTRKVKSFVTLGICKKIKQIVVYPPLDPVFPTLLGKRKIENESDRTTKQRLAT